MRNPTSYWASIIRVEDVFLLYQNVLQILINKIIAPFTLRCLRNKKLDTVVETTKATVQAEFTQDRPNSWELRRHLGFSTDEKIDWTRTGGKGEKDEELSWWVARGDWRGSQLEDKSFIQKEVESCLQMMPVSNNGGKCHLITIEWGGSIEFYIYVLGGKKVLVTMAQEL